MGLVSRLKAKIGALLASAEDPRQPSVLQRQSDLLGRLRVAIADVAAAREQLDERKQELALELPRLREEAREALVAGRPGAARLALERRQATARAFQVLQSQATELAEAEGRLRLGERHLLAQMAALRARQEVADARFTAAEAQMRISEALAGASADFSSLNADLERTEARTEALQARTESMDAWTGSAGLGLSPLFPASDAVERELMSADDAAAVERELVALQAEVERA